MPERGTYQGSPGRRRVPLGRLGRVDDPGRFLPLAIRLADALASVHAARLVHLRLHPDDIEIAPDDRVDLGPEVRCDPAPVRAVHWPPWAARAWPYLSPEQTGRIALPIDRRSDLYSLGVVLYQLLTGRLPFVADDLLAWIHVHCAVAPVPPGAHVAGLPDAIGAILLKLLAKAPEDRYQSATGLRDDLSLSLAAWRASGRIDPFPLGQTDPPPPPRAVERLHGRDDELDRLRRALERTGREERTHVVLVSGPPGVGKTALVRALAPAASEGGALFVGGKCEPMALGTPCDVLFQALDAALAGAIAECTGASIAALRRRIAEALGVNAGLVTPVLPQLARLLGPTPPPAEIPLAEAERRLTRTLAQLVGALASADAPLVVFLDDLQWADASSLRALEHWASERDAPHTLVIGAFRSNEVGPSHPLREMTARLIAQDAGPSEIALAPLTREGVQRWIADVLGRPIADVSALCAILHEKSGGNALFIAQLVDTLWKEGHIRYSIPDRLWLWDLAAIESARYADDVAGLIAARIRTLPVAARDALRLFAAHLGSADLETLSIVIGCPESAVTARLEDAFKARLVARAGDEVRFLHDRIQQEAYALTPPDERAATHLAIARAFVRRLSPEALAARAPDVARHFDRAGSLVETSDERARAAELELLAARKARVTADYPTAIELLLRGRARLDDESWISRYFLALELLSALARARFVTGDLPETERLCAELLRRARTSVDRAPVHALVGEVRILRGAFASAVDACLEGLRELGIEISAHPTDTEVAAAYEATLARLGEDPVAALERRPPMTVPEARAASDLLSSLSVPAGYTDWNLLWMIGSQSVDLSLAYGQTASSGTGDASFALGLAHHLGSYDLAFALGESAYRAAQRPENLAHRARVSFGFLTMLSYLRLPLTACAERIEREFEIASSIGDQALACLLGKQAIDFRLASGDHLEDVAREAAQRASFAEHAGYTLVRALTRAQCRLIARLRGMPETETGDGDEADALARHRTEIGRFHHHHYALLSAVVLGETDEAIAAATQASFLARSMTGFLAAPESRFFGALARAARYPHPDPAGAAESLEILRADADHLRGLAQSAPEAFAPREALVRAEIARLSDDEPAAERAYEQAIRGARGARAVHLEAIASELAARFHRARGFDTIADAYLTQAQDCYELWGAEAKVRALRREYPHLARRSERGAGERESLEVQGIVEAATAISGALLPHELHDRLLEVALQHAAAQRGCLLLASGSTLILAAASGADAAAFGAPEQPADPSRLPLSLCQAVRRSQRTVVLGDAAGQHRFASDPYFASGAVRSVLCLPIVRGDRVTAVLHLENDLVTGAFSSVQRRVLELLASQAAISIENARLYAGLRAEIAERRSAEAHLEKSRAELRAIVDNAAVIVVVEDVEGRFLLASRRFAEIFHLDLREIAGRTASQILPREIAETIRATHERVVREGRAIETDLSIPGDDGMREHMSVAFPLRDAAGTLYAVCWIATDVTSRRRAQEALEHSLSLIEAALESTADGILIVDLTGRMVRFNERFVELARVPAAILAHRGEGLAVASVCDRVECPAEFRGPIEALARDPEASFHDMVRFQDGRAVERYSQPQRLGGRVVGRVWSFRDVTARVRAKEERDRHLDEEKRARADADEAVRVRDEFLSVASHELRTPLTSLQFALQSLDQRIAQGAEVGPGQLRRVTSISQRQIRRLTVLVGLLLDVSQIRSGHLEIRRAKVDLRKIVQDVATVLEDELARTGCMLEVRADEPVIGWWDDLRLEQVVTNLLTNASKFGNRKPIEISISREGESARLVVVDHGIGIPPELQAGIFQPFLRGVSSKHYGGLGLGLFIARMIVEAHGGRIEVESAVERGTTFTVSLPIGAPAPGSADPPAAT